MMEDFVKITKETWRFYLSVLLILFLFVVCNAIYICNENMAFTYEDGMDIPEMGTAFTDIISDKTDMMLDVFGISAAVMAIIAVLVIRRFAFMDMRAKEFEIFLPVRNKSIAMHNYWFSLGITFILNAALTVVLLAGQTGYNKDMLQAAKDMETGNISQDYITAPNRELLWNCACYFIFTVFLLNIIYLGMLLCKSEVAGMLISVVLWRTVAEGADSLYAYSFNVEFGGHFGLWAYFGGPEQDAGKVGRVLEAVKGAIDPGEFWGYGMAGGENRGAIFITMLIALVAFLLIVLLSGKRELSKGKVFYFKWADALFAAFCAVALWVKLLGLLYLRDAVICSVTAGALLWFLIRPSHKGRPTKWEVG